MSRRLVFHPINLGLLVSVGLCSACTDDLGDDEPAGGEQLRSLDDGLELHWSFEDRVGTQITDLSGNGRHGNLVGGSFVSSPLGEAVSLDGVDDSISLTHLSLRAPSLYGGVDGDFTISARVRVANVAKLNTLCFGCGPFSAMYVGTATYGGKLLAAVFNQQSGGMLWPLSTTVLTNDEWREVTMVVDGGVAVRYYLDCAADGELLNANVGLEDYNFSAIGQGSNASSWYGGEIDELRVWSRALSESELAELCPEPPVEQGPVLHWTFEDHTANQITDVSGNGHHGTLSGGSWVSSPNGEAASLDGVDDSIAFAGPRSPALYGGVNGEFTISARVRVADLNKYNTLCYGCGPFSTWFVGDEVHGGRMTAAFLNQSNNGSLWTASTPAMVEDQWTEVTMVVDGGVSVRNYFNCGLDSQTQSANIGLKDYGFSAVGYSGNPARWFGGEIDELRIWDRALSEQELAGLCDACLKPILVDVDAPDGGDGKSWATAFNNLQAALDAGLACDSPEIWVAEGTYAPGIDSPDPDAPVATITAPVSIYGGFAGTEVSRDQRDFVAHPVRLGYEYWISRVVVIQDTAIELGEQVRLDGFTIVNSYNGAIEIEDLVVDTNEPLIGLHNLVISENRAHEGAGVWTAGKFGIEVVGCRFEANDQGYGEGGSGAAIYSQGSRLYIDDSMFIANESSQPVVVVDWDWQQPEALGIVQISNSVMTGNSGGAIRARGNVTATNTEFSDNVAIGDGGAIHVWSGSLEVHDCTFTGNQAGNDGGAIVLANDEGPGSFEIFDSSFSSNTSMRGGAIFLIRKEQEYPLGLRVEGGEFVNNVATHFDGGAIRTSGVDELTIEGVSFVGNNAYGTGGALAVGGDVTIAGSSFIDNSAAYGGAVQIGNVEPLVLRDSRFVGNDALVGTGGALRILDTDMDVSVINTEFVANTSVSHGGGIYGRANFVSTTFANNVAGGTGNGLFAPGGAAMPMRNVVAWPDNLSAASMILDHSCIPLVTQPNTNDGTVFIAADPFAPADLDLDGLTEWYLDPGSACVDLGGTVGEFDWTVMTTQASQCTDVTPVDAGVHYTPLSAVGPC